MMLNTTWRRRIGTTGKRTRSFLRTVGFASCSVVAVTIIWGSITNKPIDVAGPARTAVNRTEMVGAFALGCVERNLTATQSQQQSLGDCWTHDPVRLPTTAAVVLGRPRVAAVTLQDDIGVAQQWSVVVAVSERPYESATPRDKCYRIPVLYSKFGLRATLRPGVVDCVGPGADIALGYPVALPPTSPVFTTVAGFVVSYLTAAGGLDRYVTPDSGLLPAADYLFNPPADPNAAKPTSDAKHSPGPKVVKLVANHDVPDKDVPPNGTTVRVVATVDSIDKQYAPRHEDYPLTLTVACQVIASTSVHPRESPISTLRGKTRKPVSQAMSSRVSVWRSSASMVAVAAATTRCIAGAMTKTSAIRIALHSRSVNEPIKSPSALLSRASTGLPKKSA
jgi:hypothetical protein